MLILRYIYHMDTYGKWEEVGSDVREMFENIFAEIPPAPIQLLSLGVAEPMLHPRHHDGLLPLAHQGQERRH